jgi:hypothetical protein
MDSLRRNGLRMIVCLGLAQLLFLHVSLAQQSGSELLANPGLEGSYSPVPVQPGSAVVTGVLPDGWADYSSSALATVKYGEERDRVHGGLSALKINVSNEREGDVTLGQIISGIHKSHSYRLSLWERGDGKLDVAVGLRGATGDFNSYGEQSASAGTEWQHISLLVNAPRDGSVFFFVAIKTDGAAWIDDASVVDVTAAK